jgi:hypothetical protein
MSPLQEAKRNVSLPADSYQMHRHDAHFATMLTSGITWCTCGTNDDASNSGCSYRRGAPLQYSNACKLSNVYPNVMDRSYVLSATLVLAVWPRTINRPAHLRSSKPRTNIVHQQLHGAAAFFLVSFLMREYQAFLCGIRIGWN